MDLSRRSAIKLARASAFCAVDTAGRFWPRLGLRRGRDCLVGAGAPVTGREESPDNSLIAGAPAMFVRELDEAAMAGLARSADIYVANYRRFLKVSCASIDGRSRLTAIAQHR